MGLSFFLHRFAAARVVSIGLLAGATGGCSVKSLAVGGLADALAGSGDVFASDDDPELVRDALPFALKTIEVLLVEQPHDEALLEAACSGFTQYAYAFIELDAARAEVDDYDLSLALYDRAFRMYMRARDYGLRGLEDRYPGFRDAVSREPADACAQLTQTDVELAFWTGSAWASAVSIALDRPDVLADLDAARALLYRVLALDEGYGGGTIHEVMIALESLPEVMGGSPERARFHFERAVELSGGLRPGPYVSFATASALPAQDRDEFVRLLELALELDPGAEPSSRLASRLAQARAADLLAQTDDLFLEPLE